MTALWPSTLPADVLLDGYQLQTASNLISTDMDVGPPKVRRRSSSAPATEQWSFVMSYAQKVIFDSFFADDLGQGALPFTFGDLNAPLYKPNYLILGDGSPLLLGDGSPFVFDYPWSVTRTYRFDPKQLPTITPVGTKHYRVNAQVLRLT